MQLFNDLDDIYPEKMVYRDDKIICPVCKKEYKQERHALKHYEKRDCHTPLQVFYGHPPEKLFFKLYKKFASLENVTFLFSFKSFRKTQMYSSIARWYTFCYGKNVQNLEDYFDYLIHEYRYSPLATVMVVGKKESTLRQYRKISHEYLDEQDNEKFFEANEERLRNDTVFALRSMERGDISAEYFFGKLDFDDFYEELTDVQHVTLRKCIEKAND